MRIRILPFLLALFAAAAFAADNSPAWKMAFPQNEAWKTANEQRRGTEYLVELTQGGEKVTSWSQMVTQSYQLLPKEQFRELVLFSIANLRRGCPSFEMTEVRFEPYSVIYRWKDEGCGGYPPQEAIMRLDYVDRGVMNLQYAYYKNKARPDIGQWVKIVTEAQAAK